MKAPSACALPEPSTCSGELNPPQEVQVGCKCSAFCAATWEGLNLPQIYNLPHSCSISKYVLQTCQKSFRFSGKLHA
jgi:hypothetical protein